MKPGNDRPESASEIADRLNDLSEQISRVGFWMALPLDGDVPKDVAIVIGLGGHGERGINFWREPHGSQIVPLSESIPGLEGTYLDEIAHGVREPWLRAKLYDVAWCMDPQNRTSAHAAAMAYLEEATEYRLEQFERSYEIAAWLRDDELTKTADDQLRGLYDDVPPSPGENINLLRAAFTRKHPPPWAVEYARATLQALSEMDMADQDGIGALAEFLGPFERANEGEQAEKDVWREVVRAKMRFGERAEGATRIAVLRGAENLAKDRGLTELRAQCQGLLAGEDLRDHLVPIRAEFAMPEEVREAIVDWQEQWFERIRSQPTLLEGLQVLASG